jgi:2-hydroxychromene-2-carboxylate isomerase
MPQPIEFYFDFSSPYGYMASTQIDPLAEKYGRTVTWKPFLLGAVFKISGSKPLVDLPMKGDYFLRDFQRSAAYYGVPFKLPPGFPFAPIAASRAFYWLTDRDPELAKRLAKIVYHAGLGIGRDVASIDVIAELAAPLGIKADELRAAVNDQAVKDRLRAEVDAAVARNVFGSPFIFVDGEPFWGADRLPQVEKWLKTGGW